MKATTFIFGLLIACLLQSASALGQCNNSGFEDHATQMVGWDPYIINIQTNQRTNQQTTDRHALLTGGTDPFSGLSLLSPSQGRCAKIGGTQAQGYISGLKHVSVLNSSNSYYYAHYAVVMGNKQNPGKPSFTIKARVVNGASVTNLTGVQLNYDDLTAYNQQHTINGVSNVPVHGHTAWQSYFLDLSGFPTGSTLIVEFEANDGPRDTPLDNGQFAYAYIDGRCLGGRAQGGLSMGGGVFAAQGTVCTRSTVTFGHPIQTNNPGGTHLWDFGDGTPLSPSGTHTYINPSTPGTYTVKLTVTLSSGHTYTMIVAVITALRQMDGSINVTSSNCGPNTSYTFSHSGTAYAGETWTWDFGDGTTSTLANPSHVYGTLGNFHVVLNYSNSQYCKRKIETSVEVTNCAVPCESCITGFSPSAGDYVLSAWVKEENPPAGTTNYSSAYIVVQVPGIGAQSFHPTGDIIDGWQRIEGVFSMEDPDLITILLISPNRVAYFDDIRLFPFDGSMMTYVYDPVTLRLVAELDERNYAKLYEYDEEGKLVRVKKETEVGIMTIQENRENSGGQ